MSDETIMQTWRVNDVAELLDAVNDALAAVKFVDFAVSYPDCVYLNTTTIRLVQKKLTDGSCVYNLHLSA